MAQEKKYGIGFALGGGGVRGFAHLGAMKALFERGIRPDIISAVSAGAIAGAYIASGIEPEDTFKKMKDDTFFKYSKIRLPVRGLMSLDGLEEKLAKDIPYDDISELKTKLLVGATNLEKGRIEFFEEGPINTLVKASSSIPVLFEPVVYNGTQYVDGGVISNFPIEPLMDHCEKIIAISISPVGGHAKMKNLIQISTRSFMLAVKAKTHTMKQHCDLFIEPPLLEKYGPLDSSKARELYDIGYDYTKELLDQKAHELELSVS
ncbi:MAG TPA: patatin-like phospholipase family protein [Saprospiraceae bacterium]|nr:patatin-like phospholipase family protein [Saprospiraceae bacterium]